MRSRSHAAQWLAALRGRDQERGGVSCEKAAAPKEPQFARPMKRAPLPERVAYACYELLVGSCAWAAIRLRMAPRKAACDSIGQFERIKPILSVREQSHMRADVQVSLRERDSNARSLEFFFNRHIEVAGGAHPILHPRPAMQPEVERTLPEPEHLCPRLRSIEHKWGRRLPFRFCRSPVTSPQLRIGDRA